MYKFIIVLTLFSYEGLKTELGTLISPTVFPTHEECISAIMALDFEDHIAINSNNEVAIGFEGECIKD